MDREEILTRIRSTYPDEHGWLLLEVLDYFEGIFDQIRDCLYTYKDTSDQVGDAYKLASLMSDNLRLDKEDDNN